MTNVITCDIIIGKSPDVISVLVVIRCEVIYKISSLKFKFSLKNYAKIRPEI
jgi:hypothetical protein